MGGRGRKKRGGGVDGRLNGRKDVEETHTLGKKKKKKTDSIACIKHILYKRPFKF